MYEHGKICQKKVKVFKNYLFIIFNHLIYKKRPASFETAFFYKILELKFIPE
jgi:hypothetical protein